MNTREFVRSLGGLSLGALFGERRWARYAALPPRQLAQDEPFWAGRSGTSRWEREAVT